MLKVDLGLLGKRGRIPVEELVPPNAPLLLETGLALDRPLHVRLSATHAAADVVVRGTLSGVAFGECRRCLRPVHTPVETDVTLLYRSGAQPGDSDDADSYVLPEKGRELDLAPAVREHLILAAPQFVLCSESCAGLCARCGADLNEGPCRCNESVVDPRWAELRTRGN